MKPEGQEMSSSQQDTRDNSESLGQRSFHEHSTDNNQRQEDKVHDFPSFTTNPLQLLQVHQREVTETHPKSV